MSAIDASGLVMVFRSRQGEVRALNGVDLTVPQGSVFALLGPNGAGKTTAVRILTTLLVPTQGTASVAGFDIARQADEVRRHIGLSGQYAAVDEYLTGRENLEMIGRLYHLDKATSAQRAGELLERFELTDASDRPVKGYSGGMRRRLDLAGALVANPPVLFLDEPTTGLDPRSRQGLWNVIEGLVADGTTLLLTTQYLEEADRLADRIGVVDHGRLIASGTSDELKTQVGGERLELVVATDEAITVACEALGRVGVDPPEVEKHTRKVSVAVEGGAQTLVDAIRELDDRGVKVLDVGLRRPTLDDVFLKLTGQHVELNENEEDAA